MENNPSENKNGMSVSEKTLAADLTPGRKQVSYSPWKLTLMRLWDNKLSIVGLVVVIIMIIIPVLAPVIATHDPTYIDYEAVLVTPGSDHFFGTDDLGRDIFSRVVWGVSSTSHCSPSALAIT